MKGIIIAIALFTYIIIMNVYLYVLQTGHLFGITFTFGMMKMWGNIAFLFLTINIFISLLSRVMHIFQYDFIMMSLIILGLSHLIIALHYGHFIANPYIMMGVLDVGSLLAIFIIFIAIRNKR